MTEVKLKLYNSLTRSKELFTPLNPPYVGMYVCGPTVYGDAHLGHAKSYVSFDVLYRYLMWLGYKVRYVQNITDVGHLTDDADQGEDKIGKQSRLEKVDPMEVVEHYMYTYYRDMDALNNKRPSIAPRPSGHIQEQLLSIQKLIDNGLAYHVNGSVYFDVMAYSRNRKYGKLSGRNVEEMMEGGTGRELEKQAEKKNSVDFALWKKAGEDHLMKWASPWGMGYPGWHIECTVMSRKYLGDTFDIHGGGLENIFPHHECEVAQAEGENGKDFARYWLHNNMVTINGQKMGKSLGNGINLEELFSGRNKQLNKAYSPMAVRFLILMSHYRSTLDFSNEGLEAAEKGFARLSRAVEQLQSLSPSANSDFKPGEIISRCLDAMNDDLNTPMLIAELFDCAKQINLMSGGSQGLNEKDLSVFKTFVSDMFGGVLGLKMVSSDKSDLVTGLMDIILGQRKRAKDAGDYKASDKIRESLDSLGVEIKDGREGTTWISKR